MSQKGMKKVEIITYPTDKRFKVGNHFKFYRAEKGSFAINFLHKAEADRWAKENMKEGYTVHECLCFVDGAP